jgi:hypothetical protein
MEFDLDRIARKSGITTGSSTKPGGSKVSTRACATEPKKPEAVHAESGNSL